MPDKKKRKNYSEEQLLQAVAAVKNGMTFKDASEKFGVPTTTIADKKRIKYTEGKNRPGPHCKLSPEHEKRLCEWLLHMCKIGYGVTKKELPTMIKDILDKCGENIFERDNLPSSCWVYRFLDRWPILSSRLPENLGYQRAHVTEEKIRDWFKSMETYLMDEHKITASTFFSEENASRIFNLDESGFPLSGTNGKLKVITKRGAKNVYRLAPDSNEQITVLGCVSASGFMAKPYIIFPGVRPNYNFDGVDRDDFDVGRSPNGWITADCFFEWLANLFFPRVRDTVQFPIVLFMDGHTSHVNLAVSEFCQMNNIILFCFPPHASHIMQPLDVSVYGPLKKYWNQALQEFARQYKGLSMSRVHFLPVFDKAWKRSVDQPGSIRSGFRKCGLVPFNPDAVSYDRLLTTSSTPVLKNRVNDQERIGMIRMFQIFEKTLPNAMRNRFADRFENHYDIVDETDNGLLYKFYRNGKTLLDTNESFDINNNDTDDEPAADISMEENADRMVIVNDVAEDHPNRSIADESIEPVPGPSGMQQSVPGPSGVQQPVPGPSGIQPTVYSLQEIDPVPESSQRTQPGTATTVVPTSVDKYTMSPFKGLLRISDNVIITRKVTKTKPQTPASVSSAKFVEFLRKKQDDKVRQLEQKEERKRQREAKKLSKGKKPVKRKISYDIVESESENEEQMELDDNDDDSLNLEEDVCAACLSRDGWSSPELWIGCSTCERWLHKSCLVDDVSSMTDEELAAYNCLCNNCVRNHK